MNTCHRCGNITTCEVCYPDSDAATRVFPLVWTDAKPTEPGWYWWRPYAEAPINEWAVVEVWTKEVGRNKGELVTRKFGFGNLVSEWTGQFAGPIPQPEEPR